MVDARTREQKLLFVLAANIVARRRPLETAAIVNVAKLVQCGVALELEDEWDSEGEDGDLKARICKTIWMLKELYDSELLSTETDQRRLAFSAFSSILQEHDPFVWRECLLSYTELSDKKLEESVGEANFFSPFSFLEDCVVLASGDRTVDFNSPYRPGKRLTENNTNGGQRKKSAISLLFNSKSDARKLLWSILKNQRDVMQLRSLAHATRRQAEFSIHSRVTPNEKLDRSAFEQRIYKFCSEELRQFWRPLGLRLGLSSSELKDIGDEFDGYGDEYRALAVLRNCSIRDEAALCNVRDILQEIKRSFFSQKNIEQKIQNLPKRDVPFFGRLEELKQVESFFWGEESNEAHLLPISHKLQYICGVGGVGKTSLALQYATRLERAYQRSMVFIHAQSLMTAEASLHEYFLLENARNDKSAARLSVKQLFSLFYDSVKRNNRMLIVFDNADQLETMAKYLPPSSVSCHVLITTRTSHPNILFNGENSNVLVLETLEESIATSSLIYFTGRVKESLPRRELEAARKIAVEAPVEGLPIALRHAGSYLLRHCDVTFEDYWETLAEGQRQLVAAALNLDDFLRYFRLSHLEEVLPRVGINTPSDLLLKSDDIMLQPFDRQSMNFAVEKLKTTRYSFLTWEMDISDIEKNSPVAFSILSCCCVMASRLIPQEVIGYFILSVHCTYNPDRLVEGLEALMKYSLLSRDFHEGNLCYSLHHLIHRSVFERLRRCRELLEYVLIVAAHSIEFYVNRRSNEIGVISSVAPHFCSLTMSMIALGMICAGARQAINAVTYCLISGKDGVAKEIAQTVIVEVTKTRDVSGTIKKAFLRPLYLRLAAISASQESGSLGWEEHIKQAFGGREIHDLSFAEVAESYTDFSFIALLSKTPQCSVAVLKRLIRHQRSKGDQADQADLRYLWTRLADSLFRSSQWDKYGSLQKLFLLLLRGNDPDRVTGLYCLGYCRWRKDNYTEAFKHFREALETSGNASLKIEEKISVRWLVFDCCKMSKQFELGHKILKEGLPTLAGLPLANLWSLKYREKFCCSLYLLRKFSEAHSCLHYCLSVCPRLSEFETHLANIAVYFCLVLSKLDRSDEIFQTLNEFDYPFRHLIANDSAWEVLNDLVDIEVEAKEWDFVIFILKDVFLAYHNYEASLFLCIATVYLAQSLFQKGLLKEAYKVSSKALDEYEPRLFSDGGLLEILQSISVACKWQRTTFDSRALLPVLQKLRIVRFSFSETLHVRGDKEAALVYGENARKP
ncbi:uncharacterized protein [Oscarella lobularis]|uniref:uncharacterized protein isoform X2 n=1 Tax=Oscarella lobularis TaxID=121494 RepID=UPI003313A8F1